MRDIAILSLVLLACAPARQHQMRFFEEKRDGVHFLEWTSATASGFFDDKSKTCAAKGDLLGWRSPPEIDGWICTHDTVYDGQGDATLELSFHGTIDKDGTYELDAFGPGLEIAGSAVSRSSWYGDSVSTAMLVLDARTPSCSVHWQQPVARAVSMGRDIRAAPFAALMEIPPLPLGSCKAGESLTVRVQLVAQANRGHIDIDAFGFSGGKEHAGQLFGFAPVKDAAALSRSHKCTEWNGTSCAEATQK